MLAPWKKICDKTRQLIEKADISYWDITLPTKVHIVLAIIFPVVMYMCESWTIKNTEHTEELMLSYCGAGEDSWEPFGQQGLILKEINPEYSLKELMLKLKLQYFGRLMQKVTHWKRLCCWEKLKAGREGGNKGWWSASWETYMQVSKQQLELDMEQQTGSK